MLGAWKSSKNRNLAQGLEQLHSFAVKLGILVSVGETHYDNRELSIQVNFGCLYSKTSNPLRVLAWELAHELGHYLVAPPSRRYQLNYGIPEYEIGVPRKHWDLDDAKAILVEEMLLKKVGIPFKTFAWVEPSIRAQHHAALKWFKNGGRSHIQELIEKVDAAAFYFGSAQQEIDLLSRVHRLDS